MSKPLGFPSWVRVLITYILTLSLCLLGRGVKANNIGPDKAYYLVYDYHDDWQVYDDHYKAYVPYIKGEHKDYNSFSLFFDTENYRGYKLLYYSGKENYLFINASLQRKLPTEQWVVMDIDSLKEKYGKLKLFLTFYGTNTNVEAMTVQVGNKISKVEKSIQISDSLLTVIPRELTPFQDFVTLGLLFLAVCYAFLYNLQPKAFGRYFSIQDLLTINIRDDAFIVNKPFDLGNLLFVLNLSFTLAFIFMLIQSDEMDLFSVSTILRDGESLGTMFSNFIELGVVIFVLMLAKYVALAILTNLYRLDNITNVHYFKVIQASSIFFLVVVVFLSVSAVSAPEVIKNIQNILLIPISIFFLLRLILIYFTINKMTPLKNLYLFSYLCIVEVIPLIVGIRYAL
ncbi:DUF4271 domain-containing protein [Flectobacillus major]|uniref:DUF4271 domain-containing protein n=1 Tax=Flectobacillus major TaxID=103 RepID=UPI00118450B7|nr:DUF4271 domain-containing protein [Flectobacillus major]